LVRLIRIFHNSAIDTMSQIELTNRSETTDEGEISALADGGQQPTTAALLDQSTMRPVFRGVAKTESLILDAVADPSESGAIRAKLRRHVGIGYLVQLCLTSGPLMLADLSLLAASILAPKYVMMFFGTSPKMDLSACFLPIASGFLLICAELGLYPGIRLSPVDDLRRLAVAVTSIFAVWSVSVTMLAHDTLVSRYVYLASAYLIFLILLPACRSGARSLLAKFSWWGFPTLVCGNDASAVKVYEWLSGNRRLGLRPIGVIVDPADLPVDGDEPWYAGPWSSIRGVAAKRHVYWAVAVPPKESGGVLSMSAMENLSTIPQIHILSELTGLPDHWARHQQIDGLTGIHLQQNLMLPLPRIMKRIMDIALAILGGIILLPLLFYIAAAVKMSSRGPVLYGNIRIGRDGKRFRMWKFRSMFMRSDQVLEQYLDENPECRHEYEMTHKLKYDPRITRIGRFMRVTSLDELPQLWNVIRGEMSLVGPRPILLEEEAKYGEYFWLYTMVSPGISGMWQVCGRSNTSYDERLQLVAYYVRNWSLWLDIYLLLRTVKTVLFGRGAY
jgi:Undecaprenyl-phosphate galactose phosphotransferase WbaP